jgi:hypothetical protein
MEIVSVRGCPLGYEIVITTTGARYRLTTNNVRLYSRIGTSNTIRATPRLVAELIFEEPISRLSVVSADKRECVISSDRLMFKFHSDSLFFIRNISDGTFTYRHISHITGEDAWIKGTSTGGMWTDGDGGSLYAYVKGDVIIESTDEYGTISVGISEDEEYQMAHMVFPPRFFEFEWLYGSEAKPFVFFAKKKKIKEEVSWKVSGKIYETETTREESLAEVCNRILRYVEYDYYPLRRLPFGYIVIWNHFYKPDEPSKRHMPKKLDSGTGTITIGYEFISFEEDRGTVSSAFREALEKKGVPNGVIDEVDGTVNSKISKAINRLRTDYDVTDTPTFIERLRGSGFRVLAYIYIGYLPKEGTHTSFATQTVTETVSDIINFLEENNYDGIYFDYAGYGEIKKDNWYDTYRFIRLLREEWRERSDEELFIYHHNSVDVWGGYSGLRAVMVDCYSDIQLAGETAEYEERSDDDAEVDHPDDRYLRFYTSGYMLSQAVGSHKLLKKSEREKWGAALKGWEKRRVLGENLNSVERVSWIYKKDIHIFDIDIIGTITDYFPEGGTLVAPLSVTSTLTEAFGTFSEGVYTLSESAVYAGKIEEEGERIGVWEIFDDNMREYKVKYREGEGILKVYISSFLESYRKRKQAYSDGEYDVSFPPPWYERIESIDEIRIEGSTVTISWSTPILTDGEVTCTLDRDWDNGTYTFSGISGTISTSHTVSLCIPESRTGTYTYRIRSSTTEPDFLNRILYGYVGTFVYSRE